VGMKHKNDDKSNRVSTFGEPTVKTLRGHYKPLSEFDQQVTSLVAKNFKFFTEATEEEVGSVNRIHLKPSFSEIARQLNEQGPKTIRGKKWTPTGVRRVLEKSEEGQKLKTELGHTNEKWVASRITRERKADEFAIKMRDEVLPLIDVNQKNHIIADELNARGIKTRTGGNWVNVSVDRLFKRIKKLEE